MSDKAHLLALGLIIGMMVGAFPFACATGEANREHAAMRAVSRGVRSKIDTAILLAPSVAPSDVALACCVGE